MAIAFVQSKSNGAANAGPFDVVLDAPATAGNLLLAFHVDGDTADNAMPAITVPGMTDVGTSEQYANGSGGDCNSKAWYFYAAGGETTITFPDTGGGTNDGVSGVVMEFSGVASVADGGPFSTAITKTTGTGSGNADNPQIATAANDCVVLMAGAATASTNIGTWTAPANYTTNADLGVAGSDTIEARAAMAYRLSGYANPENPAAWALSGSAAGDSWNAVTLALKMAPAATPLTVQDAAVAIAADNVTLVTNLIVQDAAVAIAADNVVLAGVPISLVVQDVAVAVAADNVALVAQLIVQDAAVAIAADNVTLVMNLIVQDSSVGIVLDNVVLSGAGGAEPDNSPSILRGRNRAVLRERSGGPRRPPPGKARRT